MVIYYFYDLEEEFNFPKRYTIEDMLISQLADKIYTLSVDHLEQLIYMLVQIRYAGSD